MPQIMEGRTRDAGARTPVIKVSTVHPNLVFSGWPSALVELVVEGLFSDTSNVRLREE